MGSPRISRGKKVTEEQVEENVAVGRAQTTGPSLSEGELAELQLDTSGNLKTTLPLVDIVTVNRGGTNYQALVVDTEINLQADNLTISNVTISSGTAASTGSSVQIGNVVVTSRNWTLASGTDSINIGNTISVSNPLARSWALASGSDSVALGNFPSEYPLPISQVTNLQARTWTLASGTDSVNIGNTVSVSNPLARSWTLASGTDSTFITGQVQT